jgi:drug/metabolite transporter (DMT)-like permease
MRTNLRHARTSDDTCIPAASSARAAVVDSRPRIDPAPRRRPASRSMLVAKGILLKLASALLFAVMSSLIRGFGDEIPVGQVVFFRSAFAILPVVIIYAARRELMTAVRTGRPFGHVGRGVISVFGMFLSFASLARLPLVDATAISFAGPFVTVALAALILKERVRAYRWCAVAAGFAGVVVMLWPYLDIGTLVSAGSTATTVGAVCAVSSAVTNSGAVIQTRRLTDSETTSSIVFYFSLISTLIGLASLPFAWRAPSAPELAALVTIGILGGLSHLLLTESYRYAPASVVAPFDYVSLLWAFFFGYVLFGEIPSPYVYAGAAIVAGAGLFVIWRERSRGIKDRSRKK